MSTLTRELLAELREYYSGDEDNYDEWSPPLSPRFDVMLALIDAAERERWVPVTERMPEEGADVMFWDEAFCLGMWMGEWIHDNENCVTYHRDTTHWRPLPEPPK